MRIDTTKLGKELKRARKIKGLSLVEVGKAVGKSYITIKRYEDGENKADKETLNAIRKLLDLRPISGESIPIEFIENEIEELRSMGNETVALNLDNLIERYRNATD